jgi:hypothetical protein
MVLVVIVQQQFTYFSTPRAHTFTCELVRGISIYPVSKLPQGEKVPGQRAGIISSQKMREIVGDGSFGGLYSVDKHIFEEIFAACLNDILQLIIAN